LGSPGSADTVNHVNLAPLALLPLLALLAVRRWRGLTSRRRYVLATGAVYAAQLWTSTEVFASAVVFGAIALVIAWITSSSADRPRAGRLITESLGALALACVLGAPLLLSALGPNPVGTHSVFNSGADLANFLVPTRVTWLHQGIGLGAERSLGANISER